MATFDPSSVDTAFKMLLDEIEGVVNHIEVAGAAAFQQGRHGEAEQMLAQVKKAAEFRRKADLLRKEWNLLFSKRPTKTTIRKSRKSTTRAKRGERTPEQAYYIPILQSLEEMGGRGRGGDVCDAVYQKMKEVLKPADLELLTSSRQQRWRIFASRAKRSMLIEGLISSDTPRRIWEITEKGREYLRRNGRNERSDLDEA